MRTVTRERKVKKTMLEQECIPVGSVPSAAVAVSPTTHTPCHAQPPSPHMPPLPRTSPFATHAPPLPHMPHLCHAHPLPQYPLPCMPPPVDRMTDACENITFPQLLLRTVNISVISYKLHFGYPLQFFLTQISILNGYLCVMVRMML